MLSKSYCRKSLSKIKLFPLQHIKIVRFSNKKKEEKRETICKIKR